jgi:transcription elongation GreA/GreB family factor
VSRGLAERVEDLLRAVTILAHMRLDGFGPDDPIDSSAVVGLKDGDHEKIYFLVPVAGGESLEVDGGIIQTLTPASPLGLALVGKCVGDEIDLKLPGRRIVAEVDWVC